jgi:hypothetical protein
VTKATKAIRGHRETRENKDRRGRKDHKDLSDLQDRPDRRDQRERTGLMEQMVWTGLTARTDFPVGILMETALPKILKTLTSMETLTHWTVSDLKGRKVKQAPRVQRGLPEQQDHRGLPDQPDQQGLKDLRERMELMVQMALTGLTERTAWTDFPAGT